MIAILYGFSRFLAKPHDSLEEKVEDIQRWRKGVDARLEEGNRRFDEQSEANRVTQSALLALGGNL